VVLVVQVNIIAVPDVERRIGEDQIHCSGWHSAQALDAVPVMDLTQQ
jgi:hypothetical protein